MKTLLTLAAAVFPLFLLPAAEPAPGRQVEQSLRVSEELSIPYLLSLPGELTPDSDRKWPVILFLHGSGERRGPLSVVAKWGPPRMAARGDDLPFIVVSPQCPVDDRWTSEAMQNGLLKLLDHIIDSFPADPDRIYLTGLSMGGYGTWKLAAEHPERFAAAAPICGKGDPANGPRLVDLPIWVFHGTDDQAVAYQHSVDMVEAIRKAGGKKVRFTTLQHVGHNSWSAAYATPELYAWFNQHQRGK